MDIGRQGTGGSGKGREKEEMRRENERTSFLIAILKVRYILFILYFTGKGNE